jgi:hypothetical protein
LPTNATRALQERCEYHNNTHPVMTIIVTGVSNAATQARQMQKNDTLRKKHQADQANSCPRSPDLGINNKTYKKELASKKNKKQSRRDTYTTRHTRRLLDEPRIKLLGRASDTVSGDNRLGMSNDNKNYHFVGNPKIAWMLVVR